MTASRLWLRVLLAVAAVASCSTTALHPGQHASASTSAPSAPSAPSTPAATRPAVRSVLGLGDSVPAGARCDCTSYVVQLAEELGEQEHAVVRVENLAVNGLTSLRLLQQVRAAHTLADPEQVTVVTIGANDLSARDLARPDCTAPASLACYQDDLAAMRAHVSAIAATLLSGPGPHGPVLLTGYWNVFLDGTVGAANGPAYVRDSQALTRAANASLRAVAHRYGLLYVDLYAAFQTDPDVTSLLAPDGDHPSAAGHALITRLLRRALARTG